MNTWYPPSPETGGRGRRGMAIAAVAAVAVVVLGGGAAAVTLQAKPHGHASLKAAVLADPPSFKAAADVTPPVVAPACTTPAKFTYSGTISAAKPGTVTYEWVYSSGLPGPATTLRFTAAGDKTVTGATVTASRAGGGWGEIKLLSPVTQTSPRASYERLCSGSSVGGLTATAAVTPAHRTVSCVSAPPPFTAAGEIRAAKAETVTYYWAQSSGAKSAPATLTFTGPGTRPVPPLTITPSATSGSGAAVLVVTSPVTTASAPATYTLTCESPATQPGTAPTAAQAAQTSGPTKTAGPASPAGPTGSQTAPGSSPTITAAPSSPAGADYPPMSTTINAPDNAGIGQPYYATITVSGGKPPYTWQPAHALPEGLTATPHGATLVISGTPPLGSDPVSPGGYVEDSESPPQEASWQFPVTVTQPVITITDSGPDQATVGQPYSETYTASGGPGTPFTWSVQTPPWLKATVNGATVTVSGTPTQAQLPASVKPETGLTTVELTVTAGFSTAGRTIDIIIYPAS